ncbi:MULTISPECIES: hypothetical protein [Deinococcus]|uniref:Uncharacterized protein n=1 Tax=Deinococcus phoenicis TaxID=1476583 RepID=A0A016QKL2_9DEIO|nr:MULTISPECIES: hypothetical protein [Deinococcus]EYB66334.1 hypothetical protein DEIPH_ctg139orf0054 [Deinococcus phoenicis]
MKRHVGLELACAWNAFALQTLGDKMLEADDAADPDTVGFVPPVTFDQVNAYYTEVGRWLGHASQAGHDPDFALPAGTLPARLPDWSPVEPCPRPHLDAMIAALDAMRVHAEAAMHALGKATPEADAARLTRLRGQFEGALSKANDVAGMYRPGASLVLHEQRADRGARETGQRGAVPGRAAHQLSRAADRGWARRPQGAQGSFLRTPLPGELGCDPWVMTDPNSVAFLRQDPNARRVIDEMWALDPDPAVSVAL